MAVTAPTFTDDDGPRRYLIPVATYTATATGSAVVMPWRVRYLVFQCILTAAAAAAGDTLDVYIQQTWDGLNWDDVLHFNQFLGNGGAKAWTGRMALRPDEALGPFPGHREMTDQNLGVGATQPQVMARTFRAIGIIAGGTASFDFSVAMFGRDF